MANIKRVAYEIPTKDIAMKLIKLDKMMESTKRIISDLAGTENSDNKIDHLISKLADYELEKEVTFADVNQRIVPLVVPEDILQIKSDILLQYESNQIIVVYDEDELNAYKENKQKEIKEDVEEEDEDNVIELNEDDLK